MEQKILSFITDEEKFLALRNNSENPEHGGDFWFTVTGSIEGKEGKKRAIKREVFEETGLHIERLMSLRWGSKYKWSNVICEESNFISFINKIDKRKIKLNEENIEYEWLALDKFVERIKWDDNKEILKKVLIKALKKKLYFNKTKIENYTKD